MTNKEAIEELYDMLDELYDKVFYNWDTHEYKVRKSNAFRMAIEALKQNQWIPCEERLPEENGNYLVTAIWKGKPEVDMDYFQFLCQWDDYKDTVVAWMPLPKPYEGGTE